MAKILTKLVAAAILVCLVTDSACAFFVDNFTPLARSDRQAHFKLRFLADQEQLKDKSRQLCGCTFSISQDGRDLEICGVDKFNQPWRVVKTFSGLGTSVYQGDLDANGIEDIVITSVTGGCGMAPPTVLSTVMFDQLRRPHFFEAAGYSGLAGSDNTENLLSLPTRRKDRNQAVLVQESMAFNHVLRRDFSYWRTVLYRADNCQWKLVDNYRGEPMPLVTRYRFKNNHVLVKPVPWPLRSCNKNSWSEDSRTASLAEITLAESGSVESIKLLLDAPEGKDQSLSKSNDWPETLIVPSDADKGLGGICQLVMGTDKEGCQVTAAWGTAEAERLIIAARHQPVTCIRSGKSMLALLLPSAKQ